MPPRSSRWERPTNLEMEFRIARIRRQCGTGRQPSKETIKHKAIAMFNLGAAYYNADGVGVNDTLAYAWFPAKLGTQVVRTRPDAREESAVPSGSVKPASP
jgi:hypothetical protein